MCYTAKRCLHFKTASQYYNYGIFTTIVFITTMDSIFVSISLSFSSCACVCVQSLSLKEKRSYDCFSTSLHNFHMDFFTWRGALCSIGKKTKIVLNIINYFSVTNFPCYWSKITTTFSSLLKIFTRTHLNQDNLRHTRSPSE